jgi:apolipoprotein N-acyltransferase
MPESSRLRGLAASTMGAGLIALSFPRGGCWPLGWVCLAPLFVGLNDGAPGWQAAGAGYLAGLAFSAAAFFWIFGTCRFAHFSFTISALALVVLSAALALNWMAAALIGRRLTDRAARALRPWLWAFVFTAVTCVTERWTARIPGDMLAYTQWANLSLVQAGSWGGPHLLGFVVLLVNAALAEAWSERSSSSATNLALSTALVAGLWVHGEMVLLKRPDDPGTTARVEILQPNVDQYRKWDAAFQREILDGYYELLSRPQSSPPALVVWPETAIPREVPRDSPVAEAVVWARKQNVPHLVGILALPAAGDGAANAAQLVAPDGRIAGLYVKRELVPFGEYVPFRRFVPRRLIDGWLRVLDNFGDMSAGPNDQPLMTTAFGPTAVTICYEAAFPRWSRRDAARGASLLINLTNDGWYKDTWGPSQHFGMNVFRAIENRITEIRCGNTGISGVIDPWGVVTASLPLGARGRLDADVPLADSFPRRSFYTRHGDWFGTLCLVSTALGSFL